ncbi:IF-2B-domain-containing protein [Violaceomyces palustris]|uniref:IF-2B-domain-containing protein n=1 Tax=Violaceomyces palustris TaxID=1673888 RepID=A0ACD0NUE9_9BASI|nr:IF-2B-domain-containing protein [Violaceomyces palustris]
MSASTSTISPPPNPASSSSSSAPFSIVECYHSYLASDPDLPMPIASIYALSQLVSQSKAATTSELMESIRSSSQELKKSLSNPVPATAGLDLFTRFVVTKSWDGDDFEAHKQNLFNLAREFAMHTVPSCREKIAELALPFIKDDAVILTHSYSRVVMQVLKKAALKQSKRISVYVTESRPTGLGLKTYEQLTQAGIPCTVVLDSAVAYLMPKVDLCLVGAEGVVESGGILNAIGTYGMALIAKSANKPFFALAESFKFLRLFPLSQYDLPASGPILPFPDLEDQDRTEEEEERKGIVGSGSGDSNQDKSPRLMSKESEALNPAVTDVEQGSN